jgi:hypothetical protein
MHKNGFYAWLQQKDLTNKSLFAIIIATSDIFFHLPASSGAMPGASKTEEQVMARYFNAKKILSDEVISEVLQRIPEQCRTGALVYFSEDYYARRNADVIRCFRIYQSDPVYRSHFEIYEALSEQFGLTVRWICKILEETRATSPRRAPKTRTYSGVRVAGRTVRRMRVRSVSR